MNKCLLIALIFVATSLLAVPPASAIDHKGQWVMDWRLPEISSSTNTLYLNGSFRGVTPHRYSLTIATYSLTDRDIKRLKGKSNLPTFGEDASGTRPKSDGLSRISFTLDKVKMDVPPEALNGLFNVEVGGAQVVRFSEGSPTLSYVVLKGPDQNETYAVAFIFKNGKFYRRQVQSVTHGGSSRVVDDRIY
jgi:hypothetical protein